MTPALVAVHNIPARIPISANMFRVEMRSRDKVDPDVITNPKAINGQLALISMPAGSILTASKIGTPTDVGLAVRLKPGMRAISIAVDKVKDVSGLVEPGDRVDVLAQGPKVNNDVQPAVTILRGILVLGMGQALETAGATPSPDAQNADTVTLAVTPKQADTLMTADQNAVLRLALRSPKEPVRSEPTEHIVYNGNNTPAAPAVVAQDPRPAVLAPLAAAAPAPAAPAAPRPPQNAAPTVNGVTLIDGATLVGMPR